MNKLIYIEITFQWLPKVTAGLSAMNGPNQATRLAHTKNNQILILLSTGAEWKHCVLLASAPCRSGTSLTSSARDYFA